MNFLAHMALSSPDPDEMLGNLLGDFAKYLDIPTLPPAIQRGIRLHRQIDRFTDFHIVHLTSQQRISDERGRFAGVLIDVFYDHYLARDFPRWHACDLASFVLRAYSAVQTRLPILPHPVPTILRRMIEQDWLSCYAHLDGIDLTLQRIATRLSRPTSLASGIAELRANYAAFDSDFATFYPALVAHVKNTHLSS